MLTHTRPFKCDVSGCDNQNGFASPHDLARHKKTCHSVLTVKTSKFYYRCAAPSCQKKDKIWPRKDNFKAHLEGTHRYDEAQVAELLIKYVDEANHAILATNNLVDRSVHRIPYSYQVPSVGKELNVERSQQNIAPVRYLRQTMSIVMSPRVHLKRHKRASSPPIICSNKLHKVLCCQLRHLILLVPSGELFEDMLIPRPF